MKTMIRATFSSVFLFGHGFSLPMLASASWVLAAFALGLLSGGSSIVKFSLVGLAFAAPVAMTLSFFKPKFQAERAITIGMPEELAVTVDRIYEWKVKAISLYENWYGLRVRLAYGFFSLIMFLSTVQLIRRVFFDEVAGLVLANGIFAIAVLLVCGGLNWFASREPMGSHSA